MLRKERALGLCLQPECDDASRYAIGARGLDSYLPLVILHGAGSRATVETTSPSCRSPQVRTDMEGGVVLGHLRRHAFGGLVGLPEVCMNKSGMTSRRLAKELS